MEQFLMLVIGAALGWLGSRQVELMKAKHSRSWKLADEYNMTDMLLNRNLLWMNRNMFRDRNFDQQFLELPPESLNKDHPLFRFIRVAWFYRKVGLLELDGQVDRSRCRSLLGRQFEMFHTHIVSRAKRGAKPNDVHLKLWEDLDAMEWLREGFTSDHLKHIFDDAVSGERKADAGPVTATAARHE